MVTITVAMERHTAPLISDPQAEHKIIRAAHADEDVMTMAIEVLNTSHNTKPDNIWSSLTFLTHIKKDYLVNESSGKD